MKLIRELNTRKGEDGQSRRWGEFYCKYCKKYIEKLLYNGINAKSCGCQKGNKKHGGKGTRLYYTWVDIKRRVLDSKNKSYKYYGGKGITICNDWLEFIPFRDWALNNGYADNLVIDRKDPNGNYEPSNCRFITRLESNRNKGNTITLKIANEIRELYKTKKYTQRQLAKEYNLNFQTISFIINNKQWVD